MDVMMRNQKQGHWLPGRTNLGEIRNLKKESINNSVSQSSMQILVKKVRLFCQNNSHVF